MRWSWMKLRDRPKKGKNTEVPRIEIQNTYDNKRPNEERVFHWGLVSRRGAGLHKLKFFVHEISWMQNRFRCTSLHVGDRASY